MGTAPLQFYFSRTYYFVLLLFIIPQGGLCNFKRQLAYQCSVINWWWRLMMGVFIVSGFNCCVSFIVLMTCLNMHVRSVQCFFLWRAKWKPSAVCSFSSETSVSVLFCWCAALITDVSAGRLREKTSPVNVNSYFSWVLGLCCDTKYWQNNLHLLGCNIVPLIMCSFIN